MEFMQYPLSKFMTLRDNFFGSIRTKPPRSVLMVSLFVSFFGFMILAPLAPSGFQNGDAAVYAQQIETLSLGIRTVHIGYYLLGVAFRHLMPLNLDFALNILNTLLGALSAGIIVFIAYTITGSRIAAVASPIVLMTHFVFVKEACFAEVYVPQLFFFLLTVLFALWNMPISAGLSFGLAFLITPSTILATPFILLLRPQKGFIFLWVSIFAVVGILGVSPHLHDYLFGSRGLIKALGSGMGRLSALMKEVRELSCFSFFNLFILTGIISLASSNNYRILAASLVFLWFFPFLFGEKFCDVPVQLPLYAVLSVVAGLGFDILWHWSRRVRPILPAVVAFMFAIGIAFSSTYSYSRTLRISRNVDYFKDTVRIISRSAESNFVVIGKWSRGILLEHYLYRKSYTGVWINTAWLDGKWGDEWQIKSRRDLNAAIAEGKEIWLLEGGRQDLFNLLLNNGYTITPSRGIHRANHHRIEAIK